MLSAERRRISARGSPSPPGQYLAPPALGVAFGLLAAVTLDGVPENLALGVSLVGSEGELRGVIALLVAIFVSNLPESLVGAVAMRAGAAAAVSSS